MFVSCGEKMHYINEYNSPLGKIALASNGQEIIGLWFEGQKYFAGSIQTPYKVEDLPIFEQAKAWLDIYFLGKEPNFTPPICMGEISEFRKKVWEIMLNIPYGQTMTYGQIAEQIANETGKRVSAQAVGGAVGHNSISLIIPCHRVVGTNGSLTGYAGGLDKKVALLELEGVDLSAFSAPKV